MYTVIADRGEREEWFSSLEITAEFFLALIFAWIFFAIASRGRNR